MSKEPRYKLEVRESLIDNSIVVGIRDQNSRVSVHGQVYFVEQPNRLERVLRVTWEDKVGRTVKKVLKTIDKLNQAPDPSRKSIVSKYNTDVGSNQ